LILASNIGVAAQKANRPESEKQPELVFHNMDNKAVPLFVYDLLILRILGYLS